MSSVRYILLFTICTFLALPAHTQTKKYVANLENSSMAIEGTSTLRDWDASVTGFDLGAWMNDKRLEESSSMNPLDSLMIQIPVDSLDSGIDLMNTKMRNALKMDEHPTIQFRLQEADLPERVVKDNTFDILLTGTLLIAGVTKDVQLSATGHKMQNGGYRFEGAYDINMVDYNVEPPTAMLGTIETGEVVTITFEILLEEA
jgi:polyisoprenoid-binding protein YceI